MCAEDAAEDICDAFFTCPSRSDPLNGRECNRCESDVGHCGPEIIGVCNRSHVERDDEVCATLQQEDGCDIACTDARKVTGGHTCKRFTEEPLAPRLA